MDWDFSPKVNADLHLSLDQYNEISLTISKILKSNAKLVCFSCDKDEAILKWQPDALLDRGYTKPSMWHHYADKHRGLCLMFDGNKLNQAFKTKLNSSQLVSGKVNYSNKGILPNISKDPFVVNLVHAKRDNDILSAIRNHLNSWFPDLFLRKLSDWKNENEYRWIYLDKNQDPIYVKFQDALEAIIIGRCTKDSHYDDILRYCVKYDAEVANLNWRNGYPKIEHPGEPYITHNHLISLTGMD